MSRRMLGRISCICLEGALKFWLMFMVWTIPCSGWNFNFCQHQSLNLWCTLYFWLPIPCSTPQLLNHLPIKTTTSCRLKRTDTSLSIQNITFSSFTINHDNLTLVFWHSSIFFMPPKRNLCYHIKWWHVNKFFHLFFFFIRHLQAIQNPQSWLCTIKHRQDEPRRSSHHLPSNAGYSTPWNVSWKSVQGENCSWFLSLVFRTRSRGVRNESFNEATG